MLAAVAMLTMRAEAHTFSLWKLWSPFLFIALPTMLLTGSIALLFETIPFLRGGAGNVIYFFLWTGGIALGATGIDDPTGLQLIYRSTRRTLIAIDPSSAKHFNFSLTIGGEHAMHTFLWNGIDWTPQVLLIRLFWIAVAAGISLVASVFFHRFDPARSWRAKANALTALPLSAAEVGATPTPIQVTAAHLTPLARSSGSSGFGRLVLSELRLMLKAQRWWWYAGATGLLIGQFVAPDPRVRSGFLIAAWIWPILLWSQMGCREARYGTTALMFSSERSLWRQLPALWTAGLCLALLTGAGAGTRLLTSGDSRSLAAWFAGALFIPSLALALGIWSGGSKTFEAIYVVWWYIGPAHQIPGLDFMGTTPASSSPAAYSIAAAVLLLAAYWRRRQSLGYA